MTLPIFRHFVNFQFNKIIAHMGPLIDTYIKKGTEVDVYVNKGPPCRYGW
jgi:hypothetical protein